MRVLAITGGTSSERKISFVSARAVKKALEENGYQVKLYDLKEGYPKLKTLIPRFDIIFPVIHGEEGEGGKLHQFLSKQGKPFVGGDWQGFKKGWHKISFKNFCYENNIPTSPWKEVKTQEDIIKFGFPSVLKSSSGGSSREVVILKSKTDLRKAKFLLRTNLRLFVEKFLPGTEVTVGVLGTQALPVVEIVPPEGQWFDYKNKYSGVTREIPFAPSLNPTLRKSVQEIALKIHNSLNLGHYCRVDFIVSDKTPYALEVNTIPGMTAQSCLPLAAAAARISFPQLIRKLAEMALKNDQKH